MQVVENKRLVFVTGASRGIGKAIATAFSNNEFNVCIGYSNSQEMAEQISANLKNSLAVQVNIENRGSVQKAIKKAEDHFHQQISILVNNAAIAQEKPFLTISDDDWDQMLSINLRSNFSFSQELIPKMVKEKWGRIINISSIGGQWGGFNQVHYAAAKAGQISLTRSLAKIYSGDGITSNAIAIGLADTEMSANELDTEAGKQKVAGIPSGRLAKPSEIGDACVYLASDNAGYITGQTINMNGGMYFT